MLTLQVENGIFIEYIITFRGSIIGHDDLCG